MAARQYGDLPTRLSSICAAMTEILSCDRSSVFIVAGDEIVPTANHGNPPDIAARFAEVRFSVRHPLFALALESDEPVHVRDAAADPMLMSPELVEQARISSVIAARLLSADGQVGVITAEFNETIADFGEFDAVVVQGLAHIAALIIDDQSVREREDTLLDEIRHRSEHDELTGLPNRRLLAGWLDRVGSDVPADATVAVLLADLDRFKAVNDTFGHAAGDRFLVTVADRFRSALEPSAVLLCRVGGDEFVVAAIVDDLGAAEGIAATLAEALIEPIPLPNGQSTVATASVGIALARTADVDLDTLLSDADAAMYVAKSERRGRSVFAAPDLRPVVSRRFELELSLPSALRNREIVPWFQPIVGVRSGTCIAVEALARWMHPTRGLLGPAEFLPTLTEMGLLRDLTDCMLSQAAEAMSMPDLDGVVAFVNLSVLDIDEGLPDRLAAAFPTPSRLAVELTERDALRQATDVVRILAHVREAGVQVALDDFGTGYSSLSMLGHLPLDIVKIDRSLVAGVYNERSAEVLRATMRLGHALGLTVLTEGVEEQFEFDEVVASSVDLVQGYLLARPMPLSDLVGFCRSDDRWRARPPGGHD